MLNGLTLSLVMPVRLVGGILLMWRMGSCVHKAGSKVGCVLITSPMSLLYVSMYLCPRLCSLARAGCAYAGASNVCFGDAAIYGLLPEDGYKPLYRDWFWYKNAKEGRAFWTEPFLDEGGANVPIITYSVPIHQHGVFVGVATMDVALAPGSTMAPAQATEEPSQSTGMLPNHLLLMPCPHGHGHCGLLLR